MSGYKKYLKVIIIFSVVIFLLRTTVLLLHSGVEKVSLSERTNELCLTEERVFDYADKLTDKQEEKLRILIAKREKQIQADIVLVTLNETMDDSDVMVYSDDFQDEMGFGYNKPYENCAMLVDNWDTGYMWFHTAGNVMNKYDTDGRVNHMIGKVCEFDNISPYYAYKTYINTLYYNMSGTGAFTPVVSLKIILLLAFLSTGVFLFINLYKQGSRNTTVATTYLRNHEYQTIDKSDTFLNKHVTSRKIETSSGSGGSSGGGGHVSGGGNSYGGGGGHH